MVTRSASIFDYSEALLPKLFHFYVIRSSLIDLANNSPSNRAPFGNIAFPEGSINRSSPLINYPCLRCLPEAEEEGGGRSRVVLSTVTGEEPEFEIAGLLRRMGMLAGRRGGGEFSPARGVRQVGGNTKRTTP